MGESGSDGLHCKVLGTETLEERFSWVEPRDSHSPRVIAISDEEMLGAREVAQSGTRGTTKPEQASWLRTYDGEWREFELSNEGKRKVGEGQILASSFGFTGTHQFFTSTNDPEQPILIVQSNGTIFSSPVFPKASHSVQFPVSVSISYDRRYFAVMGTREPWGTHLMLHILKLDDTFWSDDTFVYVWETAHPEPVAKINLWPGKTDITVLGGDYPANAAVHESTFRFERIERQK